MEVKKRITEFKPYKIFNNRYVTIMWDCKPIKKTNAMGVEIETPLAIWQEHTFDHIPTLSEIKEIIINYYNKIVDNEILSGMLWKNMRIWLSTENQFNYKVAYDLALQTNGSTLPITFKFGDCENPTYYKFETLEDLDDFYKSSVMHIQNTLQKGWEIKDSIDWNIFQ